MFQMRCEGKQKVCGKADLCARLENFPVTIAWHLAMVLRQAFQAGRIYEY